MTYKVISHDRAVVLRLESDRLDVQNSPALKVELKRLLEGRPVTLVIDFSAVRFVDSSGLGALLAAVRVASRNGSRIRVAGLSPDVRATFQLTCLDRIFDIFPDEREALAS